MRKNSDGLRRSFRRLPVVSALAAMLFVSIAVTSMQSASASSISLSAVPTISALNDGNFQFLKLSFKLKTGNVVPSITIELDPGNHILKFQPDGTNIQLDNPFVDPVEGGCTLFTDGYAIGRSKCDFLIKIDKAFLTPGRYEAEATVEITNARDLDDDTKFKLVEDVSDLPDLFIRTFTAPKKIEQGDDRNVFVRIKNQGELKAENFEVHVFLSNDNILDSTDKKVGEEDVKRVSVGQSKTVKVEVDIPNNAPTGNKFLIAFVDGDKVIGEILENNNIKVRSVRILND